MTTAAERADAVYSAEKQAKSMFGNDISITMARCPAYGNEDVCILISGTKHAEAARPFLASMRGAKLSESSSVSFKTGMSYTYSVIEWTPTVSEMEVVATTEESSAVCGPCGGTKRVYDGEVCKFCETA